MMKTAFLFSGQGAQVPGMMKDIAYSVPEAKAVFDTADEVLGRSVSGLCFEGPQEELNLTHHTQPCVLAADLAVWAALESLGIRADAVAGFSLGEYAALVAAGVLDLREAFSLIQQRADFMQDAVPVGQGGMAAVMKLTEEEVLELCDAAGGDVTPANYNCPGQIVVSGRADAVDRLMALARERKIRAVALPVSAPFHCSLMQPAAERLAAAMTGLKLHSPACPVYMNVDGLPEDSPDRIREKLVLQAMAPVRWETTLRNLYASGVDTFVELGPGTTLSGFVKKTIREDERLRILHVADTETLKTVSDELRKDMN